MEDVQKVVMPLVAPVEKILNRGLDNVYINTALKVFIGLYAAFAAPKLPPSLVNLMDNVLVRIGFAFIIVFMAVRDPSIAIMVAVAFIITLQTANKYRLINTSLSVSSPGESSWLPSTKEEPVEDDEVEVPSHPMQENASAEDVNNMRASMPSENLKEHIVEPMATTEKEMGQAFTSSYQFLDAQNDNVPGSNQDSSVGTFANQHSIQGLQDNSPDGAIGNEYSSL
tara:strand:+ start:457 stop:1134 length:678 start_codon:yes stop_codon:yes gene_type:complete